MNKTQLREIYKKKRKDLSEEQINNLQENIYQQVFDLDFSEVKNVHLFLSLRRFKEIDTQPIINFFRAKGKRIVVSRCNFEDNTLSHFYFDKNTKLELNKFGVPEPVNAEQVLEKELDLIFVPLLISDETHFRVGYGKGFYDRFLAKRRKDAQIIGLNFFKPIKEITDLNKYDIALNDVIYAHKL